MIESTNREWSQVPRVEIEIDHGVFLTEEAAIAKMHELNEEVETAYARGVANNTAQNEREELRYIEDLRKYEYLTAGGFFAHKPHAPTAYRELSFEEWVGIYSKATYAVMPVGVVQ